MLRGIIGTLGRTLRSRRTRAALLVLHALVLAASFRMFRAERGADQSTYVGLAEGLENGVFSYWHGIVDPPPVEVYRTHGYPAFLAACRWFSHDLLVVKVAQAVLYAAALLLLLHVLHRLRPGAVAAQNMLLVLALVDLPLLVYPQLILPEAVMVFLNAAILAAALARSGPWWLRAPVLGACMAIAFHVRPVMLLLPVLLVLVDAIVLRGAGRWAVVRGAGLAMVTALVLGPLAFAFWNRKHHGVFRPLPIAGSAVVSNMGIWQLRLPGYGTLHYFRWSAFGREAIPWVNDEEAARHYAAYERQWQRIDSLAMLHATPDDRLHLAAMEPHLDSLFATRSPRLTMAYDSIVAAENRRMIAEAPGYYLASRLYTAVRLWITNINVPMRHTVWKPAPGDRPVAGRPAGAAGWARALMPFTITFLLFGIGLPLLFRHVVRHRKGWVAHRHALAIIAYVWLIHVPMSIQSRYTVPVHLLVFLCYALAATWRTRAEAQA